MNIKNILTKSEDVIKAHPDYFKDETIQTYFMNVCGVLLEQYNEPSRVDANCFHFYNRMDTSAIKDARGYGTPSRMFQPTNDRLQFHIGNMNTDIEYECCFDEGTWYDDGFKIHYPYPEYRCKYYHSEEDRRELFQYCLDIGRIFEQLGLEMVIIKYSVSSKGYLLVTDITYDKVKDKDLNCFDSILVFVYIK